MNRVVRWPRMKGWLFVLIYPRCLYVISSRKAMRETEMTRVCSTYALITIPKRILIVNLYNKVVTSFLFWQPCSYVEWWEHSRSNTQNMHSWNKQWRKPRFAAFVPFYSFLQQGKNDTEKIIKIYYIWWGMTLREHNVCNKRHHQRIKQLLEWNSAPHILEERTRNNISSAI